MNGGKGPVPLKELKSDDAAAGGKLTDVVAGGGQQEAYV